MDIKTNEKLNETVKDTLKMRGDNISLYALKRIEELEQLRIGGVSTFFFGVYSPENDLLAVHATEDGAEKNKINYEKHYGDGFYVDYVMLQP